MRTFIFCLLFQRFDLDGNEYTLNPTSWDSNHIHGGTVGFDKKIWVGNIIENGVEMFYSSPDGEEGFPGKLDTIVTFRLVSNSFKVQKFGSICTLY